MALTKIDDRGLKTPIDLLDNEKIRFGTGNDLELRHTGSHAFLDKVTGGSGNLYIRAFDSANIHIESGNGSSSSENAIICNGNGSVDIYHSGSKKFETTSGGVDVTGTLVCDGLTNSSSSWFQGPIDGNDNIRLRLGSSQDLQIYHDGAHNRLTSANNHPIIIKAGTGDSYLQGNNVYLSSADGAEVYAKGIKDGAVELYYDGTWRLKTENWGVSVNGNLALGDNEYLNFGGNNDLQIIHDGTHSRISAFNTGNLLLKSQNNTKIEFGDEGGATEVALHAIRNEGVLLYYNGAGPKFETYNDGVKVTGVVRGTTSGFGIDFAETSNATGKTSEVLDDYEEGSYTPTLNYQTSDDGNKVYSVQHGVYTKIGRSVTVHFHLEFTNKGTGSGNIDISLPFAVPNLLASTSLEAGGIIHYFAGLSTSWSDLKISAIDGQTRVEIYGVSSSHSNSVSIFGYSHIGNAWSLRGTITYFT